MRKEEKEEIVAGVVNGDKKGMAFWALIVVTVTIIGWGIGIGLVWGEVKANTMQREKNQPIVDNVAVLKNEISHINRTLKRIEEQQKTDKAEILEAIKDK